MNTPSREFLRHKWGEDRVSMAQEEGGVARIHRERVETYPIPFGKEKGSGRGGLWGRRKRGCTKLAGRRNGGPVWKRKRHIRPTAWNCGSQRNSRVPYQ